MMPAPLAKRQDAPPSESTSADAAKVPTVRRSHARTCDRPKHHPRRGSVRPRVAFVTEAEVTTGLPASEWLERIIKLRRAGRHDEADVELKRFREIYPQVTVPAEALPVTGTR